MSDKTGIAWTDATWNPLAGCSRVSEGCRHCYAERMAWRHVNMTPDRTSSPYFGLVSKGQESNFREPRWTGKVRLIEKALDLPLRWKRPRRIFVNSMSDLFHEQVPDEWIDRIFAVMVLAEETVNDRETAVIPRHTFQVLTKKPERMHKYLLGAGGRVFNQARDWMLNGYRGFPLPSFSWRGGPQELKVEDHWPPPNVWPGVSVEDQATADARIPILLQTPAAVRWVSYEPALGPVNFAPWLRIAWQCSGCREYFPDPWKGVCPKCGRKGYWSGSHVFNPEGGQRGSGLDWLVVGGESGPSSRPFDLAWARSAIAQCRAASVPCFVKQLGANIREPSPNGDPGLIQWKFRDRKGGDLTEWPPDLRVREYPSDGPR